MAESTILQFIGDDSYLKSPDSPNLEHDGNFTIEAWVAVEDAKEDPFILKKGDGTDFQYSMQVRLEGGQQKLYGYYGQNCSAISEFIPLSASGWCHFAISVLFSEVDNTSTAKMYINGELVETGAAMQGKTRTNIGEDLLIGEALTGKIAGVRIWNFARPREEINADMYHPLTGRESGLLACWPLDGSGKEIVSDTDSILYKTDWLEEVSPVIPADEKCLNIGWPGHYGKLENIDDFPIERISVSFWIRTFNTDPQCTIVSYSDDDKTYTTPFCIVNASNITTIVSDNEIETNISVCDGRWHHVALIWHSLTGNFALYKDGGKETFQGTLAKGMSIPDHGTLTIGLNASVLETGAENKPPFEGELSEFRIWNTVRTEYELVNDMLYRLEGDEAGLFSYWPMNDAVGAQAKDLSPQKYNLELIGSGMWSVSGLFLKKARVDQLKELRTQFDIACGERKLAIEARDEAIKELSDTIQELDQALADKEALTAEKETLESEKVALEAEKTALEAEKASLETEKTQLLEQIEELESQVTNIEDNSTRITIEDLIENLNEQIGEARAGMMQDEDNMYYLRDVKMNLRAIPFGDGTEVIFPNSLQLENLDADHLSDINFNFFPRHTTEIEAKLSVVPDLLNYTEVMAIQILSDQNFTAKVGYQNVTEIPGEPAKAGRVVNQYPKAGTEASPASVVTIFIGKES